MRATAVLLVTVLCSPSLWAQQASTPRDEIVAARKAWWDAFLKRDVDTMARIEADDFVIINNGIVSDRSRLERMRTVKPIARTDTLEIQRFELHGSIATMSGYVNLSAPQAVEPARAAFSDVWARQGGGWRLKSTHLSRPMEVTTTPRTVPGLRARKDLPADLRAALELRDRAVRTGNRDDYGRSAADDFLNVTASGLVETKADRLKTIGTGTILDEEHAGFSSYGDDMVIYTYEASSAPRTFVSEVWVKGANGWQMAHRQSTWK